MVSASAYILKVRPERREKLLSAEGSRCGGRPAAEPVPLFNHNRRPSLIVLASIQDGQLTHIGDARKGASAGTDLVRLNMTSLAAVEPAIPFAEIASKVPGRFRAPLKRVIATGGLRPLQVS